MLQKYVYFMIVAFKFFAFALYTFVEMNTVQGRKESIAGRAGTSYGSMRKGFPMLERPA